MFLRDIYLQKTKDVFLNPEGNLHKGNLHKRLFRA